MKKLLFVIAFFLCFSCKKTIEKKVEKAATSANVLYAKGFAINKLESGISIIKVTSPWPNAEDSFTYALIPKNIQHKVTINKEDYDAILTVPIENIVVTSTTHIPALEALDMENTLIGFPQTEYVSSKKTRKRISEGKVKELGNNEFINTEMVIALQPDAVIGFGLNQNKAYSTISKSNIPVLYNGEWTEETPLAKAEWIKFFAALYALEKKGDSIFNAIKTDYLQTVALAKKATKKPTVMCGAMFKDVWYLPGGKSWAAQFLKDANTTYLWSDNTENGSLSLGWENVLETAQNADFWLSPSNFKTYSELKSSSPHYEQFKPFKEKNIYSFTSTTGETGGILFFELAATRPDLVLKDLIHIFHPELLPNYKSFFYQPLE